MPRWPKRPPRVNPRDDAAVLSYGGVVKAVAVRLHGMHKNYGTLDDFIQTGWIGLLKGFDRLDPQKIGHKNYLGMWVQQEIVQTLITRKKTPLEPTLPVRSMRRDTGPDEVDFWDYVESFPPAVGEFIRLVLREGETPKTACNRLGVAGLTPKEMVAQLGELLTTKSENNGRDGIDGHSEDRAGD
jgi:hypothetical protein